MKPSEFLDQMDGHGIYGASMLEQLDPKPEYQEVVPQFTHAQTTAAITVRGLGGELSPDTGEKFIYGYTTARALAVELLEEAPGDIYYGRGRSFQANRQALRKAGF